MTTHTELQKEALWMSAKHYLENWQDLPSASIGSADCACCQQWAKSDCVGCPIRQHTGMDDCRGTPWTNLYNVWGCQLALPENIGGVLRDALEEEYRFLVELVLETPMLRFEEGADKPYVVSSYGQEVERYHTEWAANRACKTLADGGTL